MDHEDDFDLEYGVYETETEAFEEDESYLTDGFIDRETNDFLLEAEDDEDPYYETGMAYEEAESGHFQFEDYESEVFPPDTRKRIRQTTRAPFRYICHVEINRGGKAEPGRTGTLIGPKTVLTAAHCIWHEGNNALEDLSTTPIRIIPGRNGSSEPLPATQAAKLIVPAGYNTSKGATALDFGIIQLKDAIGNRVGYWSKAYRRWKKDKTGTSFLNGGLPLNVGTLRVNISGYPNDKGGIKQYWSYNRTKLLKDGMLHYLNDTARGHSGSPVWVRRHSSKGGRVLVGVHVAGDDGIGDKANRAVFINAKVRKFIKDNTI